MGLQLKPVHIFLDIDGTLEGWNGPVTVSVLRDLERCNCKLHLLSKRDTQKDADAVTEKYGVSFCEMPMVGTYVEMKVAALKKALKDLAKKNGDVLVFYVGDRSEDLVVADEAGVIYCPPNLLSVANIMDSVIL